MAIERTATGYAGCPQPETRLLQHGTATVWAERPPDPQEGQPVAQEGQPEDLPEPFACPDCEFVGKNARSLAVHVRQKHGE